MKPIVFIISILVVIRSTFGQVCDCSKELEFAVHKIENNYAGFFDRVSRGGDPGYKQYNKEWAKKSKKVLDVYSCAGLIRDWSAYFADGEIKLVHDRPNFDQLSNDEISELFQSTKTYPKWTEERIKGHLDEPNLDPIEGIWENPSGSYRTAIISKPKGKKGEFIGIILKADNVYWKRGQLKLSLTLMEGESNYLGKYYYRDHNPTSIAVRLYGDEIVEFRGLTQWVKKYPKIKQPAQIELDPHYFSRHNSRREAQFHVINEKTNLLTLPSFAGDNASTIDSLIEVHWSTITSTKNLIIDLRGNAGGTDFCYAPIIPILYTKPITTSGVSVFASPDNIQSWEVLLGDPKFSEEIKERIAELVVRMKSKVNDFVEIPGEIKEINNATKYPEKIGLVIDQSSASSTEKLLLIGQQSDKVTIFGESSAGSVDYQNSREVAMPCIPYILSYPTGKSSRLPENPLNNQGIMPDVQLDNESDWISQVTDHLKGPDW